MKKTWGIILAILLCVGMMCSNAMAQEIEQYDILYVAGTMVTPQNKDNVLGDGTVSYDPFTKTLTLNNANLAANQNTQLYPAPIETDVQQGSAPWDLTIYLKGKNTLDTFDIRNYVLHRAGNLIITGDEGAVLTNAGDSPNNIGICALNGKLTIRKVKIDLTYETSAYGELLYGSAGISIEDGADLTLVGGTGAAIWGANGDVVISGSTVKASSAGRQALGCAGNISITNNAVVEAATTYSTNAVWAYAGDPSDSSKGHITVSSGAKLTASNVSDNYPAIYADGTVTVDAAELIASSSQSGALGARGKLSIQNDAFVDVESGTATASAIYSYTSIEIDDAELKAKNTAGSSVISSWGTITASNGAIVTAENTAGDEAVIVAEGNLNITDSTINVTANGTGRGISTNANMTIAQSSGITNVTVMADGIALAARNGKLTISGGTVDATSACLSGDYVPLRADVIEISGGNVTANGNTSYGIYAEVGNIDISGSAIVNALSKTNTAVCAEGDINISGKADVSASGAWALWSKVSNIAISGGTVEAFGSEYAIVSKPDLSGYANPVVLAGASSTSAKPVTDLSGTNYHNKSNYVRIQSGILITFDANDGSGTVSVQTAPVNESVILNANTFSRDGYVFSHWNTKSDNAGTQYSDKGSYTMTDSITLYAQWLKLSTLTVAKGTTSEGKTQEQYVEGNIVSLRAESAASGTQFKEWTGLDDVRFVSGYSKTSAETQFYMPARDVNATATYAKAQVRYSTDNGASWTEDTLINALWACHGQKNVEIELLDDITLGSDWSSPQDLGFNTDTVVINGKGHTIKRAQGAKGLFCVRYGCNVTLQNITIDGGAVWNGSDPATRTNSGLSFNTNAHLIYVDGGATLTLDYGTILQNSDLGNRYYGAAVVVGGDDGDGKLIMKDGAVIQNNSAQSGGAVCVMQSGDVFEMQGGSITGNYAFSGGGAVMVEAGTFEMKGGRITDNAAGNNGGGVCVKGSFILESGSIENNATTVGGGGVTALNGSVTLKGGSITGNTITGNMGGGVLINDGTLSIGGEPIVTENTSPNETANNIYLNTGKTITIVEPLGSGASLGVTTKTAPTESTSVAVTGQNNADYSQNFFSDHLSYRIINDENTVYLGLTPTYQLTVDNGTGSGNYAEGVTVTITANEPESGKQFTGWTSEDGVTFADANAMTTTLTMPSKAVTVTANYEDIPKYEIAVSSSTGGQVSTSAITAAEGEPVNVTATPSNGYILKSLTVAGEDVTAQVDSDGKYTFTMPASDVEIIVVFDEIPETTYTVTVTTEGGGTATASPTSGVTDTEVTLSVTPDSGYQFKEWQVISGGVTVENNKFTIGTENVEIKAIFEAIPAPMCIVTVTTDGNGTASADPASGTQGTEVSLTAAPNAGYQFKEWQVISGGVTVENNKFTIGTEDVEIKAIFTKDDVPMHTADITITGLAGKNYASVHAKLMPFGEDRAIHDKQLKLVPGSNPETYLYHETAEDNLYNLVVTATEVSSGKEVILTTLIDLRGHDDTHAAYLPDAAKSSIMDDNTGLGIITGNIELIAAAQQVDEAGGHLEVTLNVTSGYDQQTGTQDKQLIVEMAAEDDKKVKMALDIDLMLYQYDKDDNLVDKQSLGNSNKQLLEIMIPFNMTGLNPNGIAVYRVHEGEPHQLPYAGEYFEVDAEHNAIILHVMRCSSYAIAYGEPKVIPQITDPVSDTTVTVIEGEKATLTIAAQNAAKYQWYIDYNDGAGWKPCGDGTATYVSEPTRLSSNGYRYYCEVTSATGETAKSPIFALVVVAPVALPETGDNSQIGLWAAMLALCGAGMLTLRGRKRRTE